MKVEKFGDIAIHPDDGGGRLIFMCINFTRNRQPMAVVIRPRKYGSVFGAGYITPIGVSGWKEIDPEDSTRAR